MKQYQIKFLSDPHAFLEVEADSMAHFPESSLFKFADPTGEMLYMIPDHNVAWVRIAVAVQPKPIGGPLHRVAGPPKDQTYSP